MFPFFRFQRAKRTLSAATVATIEIDSLLEGIGTSTQKAQIDKRRLNAESPVNCAPEVQLLNQLP